LNANRPFHYPEKNAALQCGDVRMGSLARKFGTPLYVYSADQILARLAMFGEAFAGRDHLVCYSVKANSNLSVLKLLDERGAGFDIVSGGELERVMAVNSGAAKRVVFSGVGKTAAEMDLALDAGILIFNAESEAELALLAERARKKKKVARFALRVNPDVFAETHPYISTGLSEHKFGIDIRAARRVYREASKSKWLQAAGVSVHIGSQIRSAEPFGAAMMRVAKLVRELHADGIQIESVDAGGGLGIEYHAGHNFSPAEKVAEYAAAMGKALEGIPVRLLLEPGRFLVAQAGALLTRVLYIKKNGRKTFVVTDAGMNDLLRPSLYQAHHEIVPVLPRGGRKKVVDVVGPVCESGDFFAHDREMPALQEGDLVVILDAGAYGMSLSSNYNSRPRPAEVLVEGRKARLVRRREQMKDLLGPEMEVF
jgi:diaminopimelate decarboxylase